MTYATGRRKIHQLADRLRFQANEKALEIAKNMLADGVDINLIKKYSGLSQKQIEKM